MSQLQLQYKSYDEINASPQSLLQFVQDVKTGFDAWKAEKANSSYVFEYMQKNVTVCGKPAAPSRHMVTLEQSNLDLDDMSLDDLKSLASATKIARSMDKTWDLAEFMPDMRLRGKIEQIHDLESTEGLAKRSMRMLGAKQAEHTVKTGLMPR